MSEFISNIQVRLNGEKRRHKVVKFSGGEMHVNIAHFPRECNDIKIKARLKSSDDIMELVLLHDALFARYPRVQKHIFIPYMPYARQDRRCAEGDPLSLVIFAKTILNGMVDGYTTFSTLDIHSQAAKGTLQVFLGDDIGFIDQSIPIAMCDDLVNKIGDSYLVSPDNGAVQKTRELAVRLGNRNIVYGSKIRNPKTGELTGFDVDVGDLQGCDVVIVDDICDGGGTFIGLAKLLKERNCGTISLYVTHGIFSKGLDVFMGVIDHIYTTDSLPQDYVFCGGVSPVPYTVIRL